MEKTTGYAPVNGIEMYYEVYGSGATPLVLIHGGGSTIETVFSNILPFFVQKHKVIAVELQAHGRTGDRDQPESFQQDADDVVALLKHLSIEKANILGFSDGGCTTLQIAIRYPQVVNKIIVVSSNYSRAGMIDGFFEGMEKATFADMPQPLKDGFMKVNSNADKLINMFNKDRARRIAFEDFSEDDLKAIAAPTLLMVADKDVIKTEELLKMSRLISNAQLAVLPGYHGTMLGDVCTVKPGSRQPEITSILVDEFLAE